MHRSDVLPVYHTFLLSLMCGFAILSDYGVFVKPALYYSKQLVWEGGDTMRKTLTITLIVVASLALTAGVVKAASAVYDTLTVGRQGVGGVTYFNGTMQNNTTGTGGADNPVTIGDNLRVDGRVYRGATAGTSDSSPFIVNDNMEVAGSLTIGSLSGTGVVTSANILDGTVASTDLASNAATNSGESNLSTYASLTDSSIAALQTLTITTSASPLFCTWSGYGDTENAGDGIWVYVKLDGVYINEAYRIMKTPAGTRHVTLATNFLRTVTAGTHTVEIDWSTVTRAHMYQATLDCIELKR